MQKIENEPSAQSDRWHGRSFRAKITPPQQLVDLQGLKCLYGVSIGSKDQSVQLVKHGYGWALAHFPRCAILLGDSLYRITLQIQNGIEPRVAQSTATAAGDSVLSELLKGTRTNVEVIRCSFMMAQPEFGPVLEEIKTLHESNKHFRESVTSDALMFVDRQFRKGRLAVTREQALDLAIQYLHEEIAVYLLLGTEGWLVDVYLGHELPTLERITLGEIKHAPDILRQRVNVALRLR